MEKNVKIPIRIKAILAILVMTTFLSAVATIISYRFYSATLDDYSKYVSQNLAETIATILPTEEIKEYRDAVMEIYGENPKAEMTQEYLSQFTHIMDDNYHEMMEMLQEVHANNNLQYLYITYLDPLTMDGIFLLDTDQTELFCPIGSWEVIDEDIYQAIQNYHFDFEPYVTKTELYGWISTAGAAIRTDDGEVVGHVFVDTPVADMMQNRIDFFRNLVSFLFLSIALFLFLFLFLIEKTVVAPITVITNETHNFILEKQFPTDKLKKVQTKDELEKLAHSVYQMQVDILNYISDLTTVTAEKERIGTELSVATNIQASMLPNLFPAFPTHKQFDIFASMTPAKEVGGDFYDFFLVDENHLAMVMADVSGKGVPAALFMVISKTLLKNTAQSGGSPKEILEQVNSLLCEGNEEGMFVTVWLGIYEISTGILTAANAGHEYPILSQKGEDYTLFKDPHGFVLAGMEGMQYQEYQIHLEVGDRLFVYTDGIPEATNQHDALYGTERLLSVLNQQKGTELSTLLEEIKKDVDAFTDTAPQFDDVTMLGFYRKE